MVKKSASTEENPSNEPETESTPATNHKYNLRSRSKPAKEEVKAAPEVETKKRPVPKKKDGTKAKVAKRSDTPAASNHDDDDDIDEDDYDSDSDDPDYEPDSGSAKSSKKSTPASYNLRDRKKLKANRRLSARSTLARASRSDTSLEREYIPQERQPETTMEGLKGVDEIIEKLQDDVICPFSYPAKARYLNLDIPRGVLLLGKPGTGKSSFADAIVDEIRSNGREVSYFKETGTCLSKYVGESEGNLRDLFAAAKEKAPSVIFIDEIDGLGRSRSEGQANSAGHTILTTLLTEICNMVTGEVLLLAATNCPRLCDQALLRKGRFDVTISLPLPSAAGREEIIKYYFERKEIALTDDTMAEVVASTKNSSGSDLKELVAAIYRRAVRRVFPKRSYRGMTFREMDEKKAQLLELDMEQDIEPALDDLVNHEKGTNLMSA